MKRWHEAFICAHYFSTLVVIPRFRVTEYEIEHGNAVIGTAHKFFNSFVRYERISCRRDAEISVSSASGRTSRAIDLNQIKWLGSSVIITITRLMGNKVGRSSIFRRAVVLLGILIIIFCATVSVAMSVSRAAELPVRNILIVDEVGPDSPFARRFRQRLHASLVQKKCRNTLCIRNLWALHDSSKQITRGP